MLIVILVKTKRPFPLVLSIALSSGISYKDYNYEKGLYYYYYWVILKDINGCPLEGCIFLMGKMDKKSTNFLLFSTKINNKT